MKITFEIIKVRPSTKLMNGCIVVASHAAIEAAPNSDKEDLW